MATDLTLNYANFAPLNVWIFAPLHAMYYATLTFAPLNVLPEQCILRRKQNMNDYNAPCGSDCPLDTIRNRGVWGRDGGSD